MKLVDGSDTGAENSFLKFEYLRIVGRNDKNIFQRYCGFLSLAIDPGRTASDDLCDKLTDLVSLFRR